MTLVRVSWRHSLVESLGHRLWTSWVLSYSADCFPRGSYSFQSHQQCMRVTVLLLNQFITLHSDILGQIILCGSWGHAVWEGRMFSATPNLYLPDARHTLPTVWQPNVSPDMIKCPLKEGRQHQPLLRTTLLCLCQHLLLPSLSSYLWTPHILAGS